MRHNLLLSVATVFILSVSTQTPRPAAPKPVTPSGKGVGSPNVSIINVKDFGAVGNGVADDAPAINAALSASSGRTVFVPQGTYKITKTIVVPASVSLYGTGKGSELISAIPKTPGAELVRLEGDYAAISNLWLHGTGHVPNAVDGNRGIWIGAADHRTVSRYTRVEDVVVDEFTGNGITGVLMHAKILHNEIFNNTDANIFLPPGSTYNLIDGNTLYASRYSGIDVNGANNQIINNYSSNNGGGELDSASWNGVLVTNADERNPANFNTILGNQLIANLGCGIVIQSLSSSGSPRSPYGNVVQSNVSTGHINVSDLRRFPNAQLPGGICIFGSYGTNVQANVSQGNRDNYIIAGYNGQNGEGAIVANNQSFGAIRHGYYFPPSPRVDLRGGAVHANRVTLSGNRDEAAGGDSYHFSEHGYVANGPFAQYTIIGNQYLAPAGYGFNIADPDAFVDYYFDQSNHGNSAHMGPHAGFGPRRLQPNLATPSMENGRLFETQNSRDTVITDFMDGQPGQTIVMFINDGHTTLRFNGGNLRGNGGADFAARSGDSLTATFDGTYWHCVLERNAPR